MRLLPLTFAVFALLLSVPSLAGHGDWRGSIQPRTAYDFNRDPSVVEVVIVAHERKVRFGDDMVSTKVWTYNGGIPGPTIDANLGDTLVVHFYNLLPEPSTIHWHGLELPANMDGSHISQNPVESGGYFRYEFKLLRASTFWYHPHFRSNEQVEKGLYGALIVRDRSSDRNLGLPRRESVLVLDDILLDSDGSVSQAVPDDPLENAVMQLNGREGNHLLVNGRSSPTGRIREGMPHRLRLINSSNSRFMRVSIPDHTLWRIGGDSGLLEAPIEVPPIGMVHAGGGHGGGHNGGHGMEMMPMMMSDPDISKGILLTPGERADVVFTPRGEEVILEWHDLARGRHNASYAEDGSIAVSHAHNDGMAQPQTLMTFKTYGGRRANELDYVPPAFLSDIEVIDATTAQTLPVMFGHTAPDENGDVTFFSQMKNGMPLPFAAVTAADAPTANVGDYRMIEVNNMTGGHHNFHIHGFVFQHVETQYIDMDNPHNNRTVPAARIENKDTILIPSRPGARGRSRTVTRLAMLVDDEGREGQIAASGKEPGEHTSGGWLFHCHILEHSARGMMSFLQVLQP